MGHICDQLWFCPFAFHLLGNCFFESILDSGQLFLKWIEYAQILFYLHIQVALRHLVDAVQQDPVFFLHLSPIFIQQVKQHTGIDNQGADSPEPKAGYKGQYDEVANDRLA